MRRKYILISISLLISLFIYLFYRTERTLVNEMLIRIISFEKYTALRAYIVNALPLNSIVVFSLPEGLWMFCITITSKPYYIVLRNRRIDCAYIPLVFCFTLEILQLLHITNGRFDFVDIGVFIVFWVLANYVFTLKTPKHNLISRPNFKTVICVASYGIVYLAHVLKQYN